MCADLLYFAQPSIYVHLALEISTFVGVCVFVCLCKLCVCVSTVCCKNIYIENLGHLLELKYLYNLKRPYIGQPIRPSVGNG